MPYRADTEQHWDLMNLQLVQYTGLECPWCRVRAEHQHARMKKGVVSV
jgi:hypothetical protein